MNRSQALQKIDGYTVQLKDALMSYGEMAGMTEEERDAAVSHVARIFGGLRNAGVRLAGASVGISRIPEWSRNRHG